MAREKFIRPKLDNAHHDGQHSTRQRLEAAFSQLAIWRKEVIGAREAGHSVPSLDDYYQSEQDRNPVDEEIVLFERPRVYVVPHQTLFDMPEVRQMMADNKGNMNGDLTE